MKRLNLITLWRDPPKVWALGSYLMVSLMVLMILLGVRPDLSLAEPGIKPQDIPEALAKKGKNVTALNA